MKVCYLDLFSGIGGFTLGIQQAGVEFDKHYFSEIDRYATKIYKSHFPEAIELGDVSRIDGTKLGQIDLITGGFPCQPFSVAGKQRSKEDDRYLWPEMLRLIKECQPRWIVGENVSGIINLALHEVLSDLETEGYEVYSFVVPACAVNAPHRRDRIWIIAYAINNGYSAQERAIISPQAGIKKQDRPQYSPARQPIRTISGGRGIGFKKDGLMASNVANSNNGRQDKQKLETARNKQYSGIITDTEGRKSWKPSEQERRQDISGRDKEFITNPESTGQQGGFDGQRKVKFWEGRAGKNWIEVATCLCGVDDGLPARVDGLELSKSRHRVERLKSLGNAVVVPLVAEIFRMIKAVDDGEIK